MITILSALLIILGLIFFIGGSVGLIRFPDFYTRAHAAGKGDTLSCILMILGLALYQFVSKSNEEYVLLDKIILFIKLLMIPLFILITSPTSSHSLINAGYEEEQFKINNKDNN